MRQKLLKLHPESLNYLDVVVPKHVELLEIDTNAYVKRNISKDGEGVLIATPNDLKIIVAEVYRPDWSAVLMTF